MNSIIKNVNKDLKKISQEKRRQRKTNAYTKPIQSTEKVIKQINADLQAQDRKRPSVKKYNMSNLQKE